MEHTEVQDMLVERSSKLIAEAIRPRLKEYEREQDRLIGELRGIKDYVRQIEKKHHTELSIANQLLEAEEAKFDLLKLEQSYQWQRLPGYVDLPTDAGSPPTIVFDLHGSLTPDRGFPLTSDPWPGVTECLNEWAGRGVCLVIATAALSPEHPPDIMDARMRMAWEFVNKYGLPIRYITGKIGAHMFYDDRMVMVATAASNPWESVYDGVQAQLGKRAELGKDGLWRLVDLGTTGKAITSFPDYDDQMALRDCPRGYSTPVFDVDIHRCLLASNSSEQDSELRPGAKDVVNAIYDAGFTVHASCAGWDPASHDYDVSRERLAGLQRTLKRNGVKYDEIVAKLHGTVFVDDKGMNHVDWTKDKPEIFRRMNMPAPEDEVTSLNQVGQD